MKIVPLIVGGGALVSALLTAGTLRSSPGEVVGSPAVPAVSSTLALETSFANKVPASVVPTSPFLAQTQEDPCIYADGINRWGYIDRPEPSPHQNFYFTRGAYSEGMFGRGSSWAVDFPKADRQFLYVMERTLGWDVFPCENPISLSDENLRRFPFLYMLEVGEMSLSPLEQENFRNYLLAGGFAFIDDFWDLNEWENFEREIGRVLPDHPIVDIPMDHMIYRIIYPIEQVLQVPSIGNGESGNPAYYGECRRSACTATVRGIFNEDGRLMVVMSHNSDLGDAWEWAEQPSYPYDRSNYAFSLAFNIIAYAMVY